MLSNRNYALGGANLTPHYVRGIVDGEGCFSVGLSANKAPRTGYFTMLEFKVTQKAHSAGILYDLQRFFTGLRKTSKPVGSVVIDNRRDNTLKFKVTSLSVIINVILPFFDANPLITAKCLNYKAFREIALLMNSGAHLTAPLVLPPTSGGGVRTDGIEKIKIIKDSMNLKVSFADKYQFMVNFPPVICAE